MDFLEVDFGKEIAAILGGGSDVGKPSICNFKNMLESAILMREHIVNRQSSIIIHSDVDMDGIGSGYILNRFLASVGVEHRLGNTINNTKEHGIMKKHIDWFNSHGGGLLVILDSSSNSIDLIKKAEGDVIVIDHHEVSHNETIGNTVGGKYIIVNNTLDNDDLAIQNYLYTPITAYKGDNNMSCGLVVYEWLRVFEELVRMPDIIDTMKLYQWAGITLFTDVIPTSNLRNLYYIDKTVHTDYGEFEGTLGIIVNELSYNKTLDKSFINFTLAPRINKAIRAGSAKHALTIILKQPEKIRELDIYSKNQDDAVNSVISESGIQSIVANSETYMIVDITNTLASSAYTGVIASKLMTEYSKDVIVCVRVSEGYYRGSVRGLSKEIDYRDIFSREVGLYAEGHTGAFGVAGSLEDMEKALSLCGKVRLGDSGVDRHESLLLHRILMVEPLKREYKDNIRRIDLQDFKLKQGLLKISLANSYLLSEESYELWVENYGKFEYKQIGKLYIYNINGLECKSFELLSSQYISIYVEYSKQINIYARNVTNIGNILR